MSQIPPGFQRIHRPKPNPFNEMIGPLYERRRGDQLSLRLAEK